MLPKVRFLTPRVDQVGNRLHFEEVGLHEDQLEAQEKHRSAVSNGDGRGKGRVEHASQVKRRQHSDVVECESLGKVVES